MQAASAAGDSIETIRQVIEWISLSIEVLAVLVIGASIIWAALPRGASRAPSPAALRDVFSSYKQRMGRGLLLGLELLLAADIVGTVASSPTLRTLAALGLLALIRSFLSWSLEVEIEGRWPWKAKTEE